MRSDHQERRGELDQHGTASADTNAAQKKVAVLKKDNSTGGFADEWKAAFQAADIKEEDQVDLAPILSNAALSVKDEKELVSCPNM
jgi:nucleosome binding factor SPN SPT16 subunit